MIIRFFKTSYPLQYFVLLMISLALWFPAFLAADNHPVLINGMIAPGYDLLNSLVPIHSLGGTILGFTILLGTALLFNFILERHDLTPRNSLLPAVIYVLFTSFRPEFLWLHPAMIPAFLILLALSNIMEIYNIEEAYKQVFNAGALIALASFFSFETLFFLLFVYFCYMVFRIYHWREWIIAPIGFITMYMFLCVFFFWQDRLGDVFNHYAQFFADIRLMRLPANFSLLSLILTAGLVILGLWSLLKIASSYSENILVIRKQISGMLWFSLTTLIITFISGSSAAYTQLFVMTGLALIASISLSQIKRVFWMEIILGLMLLLSLINNYTMLIS
ncbi:MAG: hypothetical protein KQI35_09635 [Bacteroidetes bacterium]|nr:hypothetical protein [Bacteroidota bacterium]